MIHVAADFLVHEYNAWLAQKSGGTFGNAKLSPIATDTGKWAIPEDQIGVALVNVEEERAVPAQVPRPELVDGRQVLREPELRVNLLLLFAAHFKNYGEALKHLSFVLTFFQAHAVFARAHYSGLDARIARLGVDLVPLGYEQLNQLWAYVGARQLPSAVYRVRLVVLQDDEPAAVQPPITSIGAEMGTLAGGNA